MKKTLLLFIVLYGHLTHAALAPNEQNITDLDVMIEYIKNNTDVASALKSIDLENYIIYLTDGCMVTFAREESVKPEGWVGPIDPLVFKNSTCDGNLDVKDCTGTIGANLDIHIPSATYGSSNIWFDLEYKGIDAELDNIWKLKSYGNNQ